MIPSLISLKEVSKRLEVIFPEGIPDRNYFIREISVKTIFVFLYIDAVEGSETWLAPKHVLRMSDKQSRLQEVEQRIEYALACMKPGYQPISIPWYRENTRESIRDETINGLSDMGIIELRPGIPTTSSKGRYQLKKIFADLFKDSSSKDDIEKWRRNYLSESHLAKVRIMKRMSSEDQIHIILPSGISRKMEAGPSSILTKAIVEEFGQVHLKKPVVIWISESSKKVIAEDDDLMRSIGIPIDQKTLLPDIVLADTGRNELLLIFVEVVATDGPMTQKRSKDLMQLCLKAGFTKQQVLLVSAFSDRNSAAFRRRFSAIAIDSLIWFASEPEVLFWVGKDQEKPFLI